jgi:hypothetical protein
VAEERVQVLVRREGGFAGMRLDTELDTRDLAPADAHKVRDLVSHVRSDALAPQPAPADGPDMSTWEVSIRRGDHTWRTAFDDQNIPHGLRPLLDLVLSRGRTTGSGPPRATE